MSDEDLAADRPVVHVIGELADDHAADLTEGIHAALREIPLSRCDLTFVLVDDEQMSRLHQSHLGVSGTTDVLTFDLSDSDAALEAEVYICVDEARRRAEGFGHGIGKELLLYAVHGVLHLSGFDDHDDDAYAKMHAEEDRILTRIGVGRVFAGERRGRERR